MSVKNYITAMPEMPSHPWQTAVVAEPLSEGDLWMMGEAREMVEKGGWKWEDVGAVRAERLGGKGWENWWKMEADVGGKVVRWVAKG